LESIFVFNSLPFKETISIGFVVVRVIVHEILLYHFLEEKVLPLDVFEVHHNHHIHILLKLMMLFPLLLSDHLFWSSV
jgi:hypothetical protein